MLQEFYKIYPKYANLDLYIVGESYGNRQGPSLCILTYLFAFTAGHYVPATAQVIVESSSPYAKNLKGIGIGNGWVDPKLQYGAYSKVRRSHLSRPQSL